MLKRRVNGNYSIRHGALRDIVVAVVVGPCSSSSPIMLWSSCNHHGLLSLPPPTPVPSLPPSLSLKTILLPRLLLLLLLYAVVVIRGGGTEG